jgi:hypothetical protein
MQVANNSRIKRTLIWTSQRPQMMMCQRYASTATSLYKTLNAQNGRHQQPRPGAGPLGSTWQFAFAALDLPTSICQVYCAALLLVVANRLLPGLLRFIPAPVVSARPVGQLPSDEPVTADPDHPTAGIRSGIPLLAHLANLLNLPPPVLSGTLPPFLRPHERSGHCHMCLPLL